MMSSRRGCIAFSVEIAHISDSGYEGSDLHFTVGFRFKHSCQVSIKSRYKLLRIHFFFYVGLEKTRPNFQSGNDSAYFAGYRS